jgi:ribosomal protein S12 methylthiotransferase
MDMPLQHASRDVLAQMLRGSSGDAFLKMLGRVRATIPGIALRTSFIVGFPGETKEAFGELCDFVRAAEFDWMGVFCYSDVDTAKSFALDAKVDPQVAAERRDTLMAIQKKISARKLRSRKGRRFTALLEGPSKESEMVWEARLEGMAPDIDGKVFITEIAAADENYAPQAGDVATVEITETHDYDLVGRVVEVVEQGRPLVAQIPATAQQPVARIATGAALRVLA